MLYRRRLSVATIQRPASRSSARAAVILSPRSSAASPSGDPSGDHARASPAAFIAKMTLRASLVLARTISEPGPGSPERESRPSGSIATGRQSGMHCDTRNTSIARMLMMMTSPPAVMTPRVVRSVQFLRRYRSNVRLRQFSLTISSWAMFAGTAMNPSLSTCACPSALNTKVRNS